MANIFHAARGASPIRDEVCSRAARESSMRNHLLIAGALVSALAGFAASTANAGSPPTPPRTDYVVPVERASEAAPADAGVSPTGTATIRMQRLVPMTALRASGAGRKERAATK
jgi:hypothetical protein